MNALEQELLVLAFYCEHPFIPEHIGSMNLNHLADPSLQLADIHFPLKFEAY